MDAKIDAVGMERAAHAIAAHWPHLVAHIEGRIVVRDGTATFAYTAGLLDPGPIKACAVATASDPRDLLDGLRADEAKRVSGASNV